MKITVVLAAAVAALAYPARAAPASGSHPAEDSAIHLDWARTPRGDELERFYPADALQRGMSGEARIQCAVEPDGALVECEVLEEKPAGMGFGPAAIKASARFRMTPYRAALVRDRLPRVVIPIHWALAPAPAEPAMTPLANSMLVVFIAAWFVGFGGWIYGARYGLPLWAAGFRKRDHQTGYGRRSMTGFAVFILAGAVAFAAGWAAQVWGGGWR